MILEKEPINQVIWTSRCKVMAKYVSMYFDIFQKKLCYIAQCVLFKVYFSAQPKQPTSSDLS